MPDARHDRPSPFIARWLASSAPASAARAIDAACGRGRHSLALAREGYRVTAIDIRLDALRSLSDSARAEALPVFPLCADLERFPWPTDRFDMIVVTRYLDRRMFGRLCHALAPGGILLYETFTEHQRQHQRGPTSPDHLLKPGELRTLVRGLDVLFDEEVMEPEAVARIAARRPCATRRNQQFALSTEPFAITDWR